MLNETGEYINEELGWKQIGTKVINKDGQELEVGDKVLYDYVTEATKLSETSYAGERGSGHTEDQIFILPERIEDSIIEWYVLGAQDGKLLLVSSTIQTSENKNYCLYGQVGYANAIYELEKIASLYGQSRYVESSRSINVDDINRVTGYDPMHTGINKYTKIGTDMGLYNYNSTKRAITEYGNKVTYSFDGTEYPAYTSTNGANGKLTKSHNDSETGNTFSYYENGIWNNIPYTEVPGLITVLTNDLYKYYPETLTVTSDSTAEVGINETTKGTKAYKSLFKANGIFDNYWLNSQSMVCTGGIGYFGIRRVTGGFVYYNSLARTDGNEDEAKNNGVRAVVILKSDIKLTGNSTTGYEVSF